jgi:hypothetical protein
MTHLRTRNYFSYVGADGKIIFKGDFNECVSEGRFRGKPDVNAVMVPQMAYKKVKFFSV